MRWQLDKTALTSHSFTMGQGLTVGSVSLKNDLKIFLKSTETRSCINHKVFNTTLLQGPPLKLGKIGTVS